MGNSIFMLHENGQFPNFPGLRQSFQTAERRVKDIPPTIASARRTAPIMALRGVITCRAPFGLIMLTAMDCAVSNRAYGVVAFGLIMVAAMRTVTCPSRKGNIKIPPLTCQGASYLFILPHTVVSERCRGATGSAAGSNQSALKLEPSKVSCSATPPPKAILKRWCSLPTRCW